MRRFGESSKVEAMFLFRAAFWVGLAVMLMPTDEKNQARLLEQAQAALHWSWTFCDRNAATCKTSAEAWTLFVKKAEFGASLAAGMLQDWSEKAARDQTAAPPLAGASVIEPMRQAPRPIPSQLKQEDMLPPWRGNPSGRTGA
jgi:hypothetical protein